MRHAVERCAQASPPFDQKEIEATVREGEVVENYPEDIRGQGCLLLGRGAEGRPIHIVCSPKPDMLAIITCYVPDPVQ